MIVYFSVAITALSTGCVSIAHFHIVTHFITICIQRLCEKTSKLHVLKCSGEATYRSEYLFILIDVFVFDKLHF